MIFGMKLGSLREFRQISQYPRVVCLPHYHTVPTLGKRPFKNIVGKGENAGSRHFFPFPAMFSTLSKKEITILATIELSSAML